jgi:apolipoprotein N-acyltransferase
VDQMERRLLTRTLEQTVRSKSKLIIWPESPAPMYYFTEPRFRAYVTDLARTTQAYFLFGTVGYTADGSPRNSAVLLGPGGELAGRYDKIYLVPFGEFVPPVFGFVNRITKEIGDFTPGEKVVTFPFGAHRIGTFICYESAFPHLVRQFRDADLYVNISNDGYFGRSYARQQHLKLVRMRAAENSRWIVRSTNDGITAVVDPSGRVTQTLEPFKETAGEMKFGYSHEMTPYARFGDWFAWSALAFSVALSAWRARSTSLNASTP